MDMPAQVQVVENRSEVTGTVAQVVPHKTLAGHSLVTLAVDTVAPVDGYANLFAWAKGVAIDVAVANTELDALGIAPGQRVTWVIKRTTPGSAALVQGSSAAMTVQPVENQADLTGTIRTLAPRHDLPGYHVVSLEVETVAEVGKYPNLFSWATGQSIEVTVPNDAVTEKQIAPGQKVTWRVKKTGPTSVFLVPGEPK